MNDPKRNENVHIFKTAYTTASTLGCKRNFSIIRTEMFIHKMTATDDLKSSFRRVVLRNLQKSLHKCKCKHNKNTSCML